MELSKNLADRYFSTSDISNLKSEISKKISNSEEYQALKKIISEAVTEVVAEVFPDKEILELFKIYPRLFKSTNSIDINLSSLGILSNRNDAYTENDGSVYLPGSVRIITTANFPCKNYSIELTEGMIANAPSSKIELIKEWISRGLHLLWLNKKEIHDFNEQSHSIKTFGRLYRVNKEWYELIVKTRYPESITYEPKEVSTQKQENADKFVTSLNNLKTILEL